MNRLVIIGASGVIGNALHQLARKSNATIIATARTRVGDGILRYDMQQPLKTLIPDLCDTDCVVLLAGYSAPAFIAANPKAAIRLNGDASKALLHEVEKTGARFVFLSSDQVFDGGTGGYTENSIPRPLNLYGRLKRQMEHHVLGYHNGVVARTGWNVGWRKTDHCPVAQCYATLLHLNAKMATDNYFNVTDVNDTAAALLKVATMDKPEPIYHFVSDPELTRVELAEMIEHFSLYGSAMHHKRVPFETIEYSEPRPKRAHLAVTKPVGVEFRSPRDVIGQKVIMLDQWQMEAQVMWPKRVVGS